MVYLNEVCAPQVEWHWSSTLCHKRQKIEHKKVFKIIPKCSSSPSLRYQLTHYYFNPPIINRWYSSHTGVLSNQLDDTWVLYSHLSIIQLFEYDAAIWPILGPPGRPGGQMAASPSKSWMILKLLHNTNTKVWLKLGYHLLIMEWNEIFK